MIFEISDFSNILFILWFKAVEQCRISVKMKFNELINQLNRLNEVILHL